jgi:hypothetical protein
MSAEDFFLSAIALFVFFFVVTPVLTRLCSRAGEQKKSPHPRSEEAPQPGAMRRAG